MKPQNKRARLVICLTAIIMGVMCRVAEAVFCTACGTENPNEARFCSKCGREMVVKASEVSVATHRWPDLPWRKHLLTKMRWGMSPQEVSGLLNNAPLKLVDQGRDTGTYMIADAVDKKILMSDAQTGAFIQALAGAQGRGPTHFTMRYGQVKVMDPSFTFIVLANEYKLAALGFRSLPGESAELRKYLDETFQNRKSSGDDRSYNDMWADSETLIKAEYWQGDEAYYEVKVINWPAFQDIGTDYRSEVNEYLASWHRQREEKPAPCSKCEGTGRITIPEHTDKCDRCNGTGWYAGRYKCGQDFMAKKFGGGCGGTGKMTVPARQVQCPLCRGSGQSSE